MWTEFEDEDRAARTRAVLESLVGRRVVATKQTFFERDASDAIVINHKGEKQTRTRLAPDSLFVLRGNGDRERVDLGGIPLATCG